MSVLNELERLLREAAQQQQAGRVPARRPAQPRPPTEIVEAEIIEAEPVYEGISSEVARDVDSRDIVDDITRLGAQAEQLGADIVQEGEKLESHLRASFDHDLGKIHDETVTDAVSTQRARISQTAADIASALRTPTSIRQAVILKEVLQRPEHRW